MYVSAPCECRSLWRSEEASGPRWLNFLTVLTCQGSGKNQTWILHKSIKCSKPLSRLSTERVPQLTVLSKEKEDSHGQLLGLRRSPVPRFLAHPVCVHTSALLSILKVSWDREISLGIHRKQFSAYIFSLKNLLKITLKDSTPPNTHKLSPVQWWVC